MAIMGRPRKEINIKEFEKLCGLLCTEEEIAAFFNMSVDTLATRVEEHYGCTFSEVFAEKRQFGKMSLRRKQHRLAEKNAAMAIFLGKNYLNQSDKQEIDQTHKGNITLAYNLDKEPED